MVDFVELESGGDICDISLMIPSKFYYFARDFK